MNATNPLAHLKIASPCSARWEDMTGNDRARFCAHCQKNVFNLSSLTADAVTALIREKEGRLCVRYYQRVDGTVLTADCPIGVARVWQRTRRLAAAGVALLIVSLSTAFSMARTKDDEERALRHSRNKIYRTWDNAVFATKKWLNPQATTPPFGRMVMGDVCMTPRKTNAPSPSPVEFLGEVWPMPQTNAPAVKPPMAR